jgi:hypothetical protein
VKSPKLSKKKASAKSLVKKLAKVTKTINLFAHFWGHRNLNW